MSKIGVAVGEDFPLQDLDGLPPDPPEESNKSEDRASEATPGRCGERCSDAQSEFARWKWRREGQRLWDADVRNEGAEWEARNARSRRRFAPPFVMPCMPM